MTIEELEKKLKHWRKNKKSYRDRILPEYWDAAVALTKKSSVASVATRLNLNLVDLRKKVGPVPRPAKQIVFKELPAVAPSKAAIFELTTPAGVTIKVYQ